MPVRSRIADRPLLAFAVVTLAWSWTAWLAGSLLSSPSRHPSSPSSSVRGDRPSPASSSPPARAAGAVVGVCWGLWHLPFFVLPGTGIVVGGLPPLAFVALTTCLSVLVGWLVTVGRGSVLLAVLFHASVNTTFGTLVGVGSDTGSVVAVVAVTVLVVAVLVAVRQRVTRVEPAPV